jgi:DTW domain-containing protein
VNGEAATPGGPRSRRPVFDPMIFCPHCRMARDLCVCSVIEPLPTRTRVLIVMHRIEMFRQSNSGRLVRVALPNSEILVRGTHGAPLSLEGRLDPGRRTLLLYPGPEAVELGPALLATDPRPVTLIVPDGTWNHTRKMPSRVPGLASVPQVRLPQAEPSAYRLRRAPHADRLATFEAVARALGLIEGPALRERLEWLFAVTCDRVLWSQGKLPEAQVRGGLPFRTAG